MFEKTRLYRKVVPSGRTPSPPLRPISCLHYGGGGGLWVLPQHSRAFTEILITAGDVTAGFTVYFFHSLMCTFYTHQA